MSANDRGQDDDPAERRTPDIDLDELVFALNCRDPLGQHGHGLNLESGRILFRTDSGVDEDGDEDPGDEGAKVTASRRAGSAGRGDRARADAPGNGRPVVDRSPSLERGPQPVAAAARTGASTA